MSFPAAGGDFDLSLLSTSVSNARIHAARSQHGWKSVLRMKATLCAVGCMALLCAPSIVYVFPHNACHNQQTSLIIKAEGIMKLLKKQIKIERPQREKVDREQALKRVKALPKRKEKIIAAIREDTHRDFHS